jgi:hypothetical protein
MILMAIGFSVEIDGEFPTTDMSLYAEGTKITEINGLLIGYSSE